MSICYNKARKKYFISYKLKMLDGSFKSMNIYNKAWTKERGKKYLQQIEDIEIEKDVRKRKLFLHSGDNITLRDLLEKYTTYVYLQFGEQTAYSKINGLNKYLFEAMPSHKDLDKVFTIQNVEQYKEVIVSKKLSPDRTNSLMRYLKELLVFASDRDYISYELCRKLCNLLKSISCKNSISTDKIKYWTVEEWELFINTFDDNDRWKIYFEVAYMAALRIGEALALTWDHFYPERNTLYIESSVQNNGKLSKTKNTSSNASVTIPKALTDRLVKFREQFCASDDEYIFFADGKSSKTTIRRVMKKHIEMCDGKVTPIPPHGLRHSCASRMINMGISPLIVSKHLRHSSVKETLDTYSHIFPNETVNVIEDVFKMDQ